MNMDKSNKDKSITKTDRLSKYNRINSWVESSGLLSDEQIDIIIEADRRMMLEENTEAVNSSICGEAYFNKPEYVESSPLSDDEKKILSSSFVGKSKLKGNGFLNSITSDGDYFNQTEYLSSSPLSENQKEEMSKTEVGETDFENLGDFKFLKE